MQGSSHIKPGNKNAGRTYQGNVPDRGGYNAD
jgi:hypothetical protein